MYVGPTRRSLRLCATSPYEQGSPPRPENLDDPSEELPGVEVVVLRFGTWQAAIAAAGLEGE